MPIANFPFAPKEFKLYWQWAPSWEDARYAGTVALSWSVIIVLSKRADWASQRPVAACTICVTPTLMMEQGVKPKIVSERLDHASVILTLDTYSHVLPGLQEEAAEV